MEAYLDNAAATKPLDTVIAAFAHEAINFANPAAIHHPGIEASRVIKKAENAFLAHLNVAGGALVFVSGATEANNLAISGITGKAGRVITTAVEHPSVAEPVKALGGRGFEVVTIKPGANGSVDCEEILHYVNNDTRLVSIMAVNNETGAVNDIAAISSAIKRANPRILFHTDGAQSFGKVNTDLSNVDLYSVSAHKIGGLKGAGALYIRRGVNLNPIIKGGSQQNGLRAGTENSASAIAFAVAAGEAFETMAAASKTVSVLNDALAHGIMDLGGLINSPKTGSSYILNASFPGVMPEALATALSYEGVYISTGSACSQRELRKRNRFVTEYGWERQRAESAVRFSFSRFNTISEIEYCLETIKKILPNMAAKRGLYFLTV